MKSFPAYNRLVFNKEFLCSVVTDSEVERNFKELAYQERKDRAHISGTALQDLIKLSIDGPKVAEIISRKAASAGVIAFPQNSFVDRVMKKWTKLYVSPVVSHRYVPQKKERRDKDVKKDIPLEAARHCTTEASFLRTRGAAVQKILADSKAGAKVKSLALGDKLPDASSALALMSDARKAQLAALQEGVDHYDSADEVDHSPETVSIKRKRDDLGAPRWPFQMRCAAY